MNKLLIATAVGMFALGAFTGHIATASNVAAKKIETSRIEPISPMNMMITVKNLPVESHPAF